MTAILVLAKAPEPGRVKTRLCPPLCPEQAAELAAAALLDTITAAATVPGARPVVVLTGLLHRAARGTELAAALREVAVLPQRGDGLGERIAAAHCDAAALFPGHPTLQIGMDTPQLDAARLAAAAAALARPGVDAVLGPAVDGGWWGLGLRRPADAALVAAVPTSRADTGERTGTALRSAGLTVSLLPELSDVDTATDALAVAAAAPGTRFAAAVTGLPPGLLARGSSAGPVERRPA
ncbi:TIGR04282 family arsenosugar biosynthesis glycosyltransferase [Pseudonocardia xinjiangensis]|uniref:TIGR04282 family arsenosugar biosynthesis glycosyltransferase n=1 Tax=Pseudonocardia xinjiangensis TaxID=75289 RepID=UPI003D8F216E